jgi:hypothetical protein
MRALAYPLKRRPLKTQPAVGVRESEQRQAYRSSHDEVGTDNVTGPYCRAVIVKQPECVDHWRFGADVTFECHTVVTETCLDQPRTSDAWRVYERKHKTGRQSFTNVQIN